MTDLPDSKASLRRFDLNLLPILKALLATHSVARSSTILGLSQSATSGALTRLRGMFGDPLLVLVGRNLVPTPYAEALRARVDHTFAALQGLFDQRSFTPDREERCFVISSSDYVISELSAPLLKLLVAEAPRMSVRFIEISSVHQQAMLGGDIDFMFAPQNNQVISEEGRSTLLSQDEMVIVASSRYAMPATGLDLETYLGADHASYGVADSESFEQWALATLGLKRRVLITVPQFNNLPGCVAACNCLAMMPRQVAQRYASSHGLVVWPVPFDIPPLRFSLYWSRVLDRNPAHLWFRDLVARAWATVTVPAPDPAARVPR